MSKSLYVPFNKGQQRRWTLLPDNNPEKGDPRSYHAQTDRGYGPQYEMQSPKGGVVCVSWQSGQQSPLGGSRLQGSTYPLKPLPVTLGFFPLRSPGARSARSNQYSTSRLRFWKRKTFSGWKVGATAGAVMSAAVLTINLSLTIWAALQSKVDSEHLGILYEGRCTTVKAASLWIHLAINLFSSILLSSSNYCMQALSSPTRAEVDREHSKKVWLDIGLPSVRNLRKIAWPRVILWWCLALSSVPLHLMYNSAVFSTLAAREYAVVVAAPEFVDSGAWNTTAYVDLSYAFVAGILTNATTNKTDKLTRLDKAACIKAYAVDFVSARKDVIVISTSHNSTNSFFYAKILGRASNTQNFTNTVCNDYKCTAISVPPGGADIKDNSGDIDYCLSQEIDEQCKLQFSLYIMIIVILFNLVKLVSMGLTIWKHGSPPLVTLGDAVSSFLEVPDKSTEGMCVITKADILKGAWEEQGIPKVYPLVREFWFRAVSWKRWLVCNGLCLSMLVIAACFLNVGINGLRDQAPGKFNTFKDIYDLGLGTVSSDALAGTGIYGTGPAVLLLNVLLANSPQALLSFLYLTYHGIFICMVSADEWSRFAHERKTLRVTSPSGKQRSTYYLQLPYRYALPLLALSGTLHWLASQTLFLARITFYNWDGEVDQAQSISTCGYSCIAIIFVLIVGFLAVVSSIGMGFRRYPAGIPLAAGCSAAISAACHPPLCEDADAAVLPLKWGVVSGGHCSFSSGAAQSPVAGYLYAGEAKKRTTAVGG